MSLVPATSAPDRATWLVFMAREFPDELLSAHLDGELSDAEREEVERHLAASPSDRQTFEDLKALRGELASLPRAEVRSDFAERVVQAAVAEAKKQNEARGVVSQAPPVQRHFWRRWKNEAMAASLLALAACLLLVVVVDRFSRPEGGGQQPPAVGPQQHVAAKPALKDQLLSALANAAPKNRETVVLRLSVGRHVAVAKALDAALGKAGIGALASGAPGAAARIEEAYVRSLAGTKGGDAEAAEEALFIEAPLADLEGAIANLAAAVKDPLEIEMCGKFALQRGEERAEGEGPTEPAKPFAQHLDARHFHLAAQPVSAGAAKRPPVGNLPANQPVRVLLLIDAR